MLVTVLLIAYVGVRLIGVTIPLAPYLSGLGLILALLVGTITGTFLTMVACGLLWVLI